MAFSKLTVDTPKREIMGKEQEVITMESIRLHHNVGPIHKQATKASNKKAIAECKE